MKRYAIAAVLVLGLLIVQPAFGDGGKIQVGAHGGITFSSESDADNRYPFGGQVSYYIVPSIETGLYVWVALDEDEVLGTKFTSYETFIGAEANYHLSGLPGPFLRRLHVGAKIGNALRGVNEEGNDSVDTNALSFGAEVGWAMKLIAGLSVGIDAVWMHMPEAEETIERDLIDVTYTFEQVSYTSILASVSYRF